MGFGGDSVARPRKGRPFRYHWCWWGELQGGVTEGEALPLQLLQGHGEAEEVEVEAGEGGADVDLIDAAAEGGDGGAGKVVPGVGVAKVARFLHAPVEGIEVLFGEGEEEAGVGAGEFDDVEDREAGVDGGWVHRVGARVGAGKMVGEVGEAADRVGIEGADHADGSEEELLPLVVKEVGIRIGVGGERDGEDGDRDRLDGVVSGGTGDVGVALHGVLRALGETETLVEIDEVTELVEEDDGSSGSGEAVLFAGQGGWADHHGPGRGGPVGVGQKGEGGGEFSLGGIDVGLRGGGAVVPVGRSGRVGILFKGQVLAADQPAEDVEGKRQAGHVVSDVGRIGVHDVPVVEIGDEVGERGGSGHGGVEFAEEVDEAEAVELEGLDHVFAERSAGGVGVAVAEEGEEPVSGDERRGGRTGIGGQVLGDTEGGLLGGVEGEEGVVDGCFPEDGDGGVKRLDGGDAGDRFVGGVGSLCGGDPGHGIGVEVVPGEGGVDGWQGDVGNLKEPIDFATVARRTGNIAEVEVERRVEDRELAEGDRGVDGERCAELTSEGGGRGEDLDGAVVEDGPGHGEDFDGLAG